MSLQVVLPAARSSGHHVPIDSDFSRAQALNPSLRRAPACRKPLDPGPGKEAPLLLYGLGQHAACTSECPTPLRFSLKWALMRLLLGFINANSGETLGGCLGEGGTWRFMELSDLVTTYSCAYNRISTCPGNELPYNPNW